MKSKNDNYNSMYLDEWVYSHYVMDDLQSIFLNMDRALKYIHERGYCIEIFFPSEIQVLNNDDDYVLFNKLMKLPDDEFLRKKMIQEDIFNSALIQIGFYSIRDHDFMNSIQHLNPDFLRENFEEFVQFLPSDYVPYYRGVIQRGASVYLCEFALEKRNRDLKELEKQMGEDVSESKILVKENISLTNDSINDVIYSQINGMRDKAFINLLLVPTIILGMLLVFGVLSWVASLLF